MFYSLCIFFLARSIRYGVPFALALCWPWLIVLRRSSTAIAFWSLIMASWWRTTRQKTSVETPRPFFLPFFLIQTSAPHDHLYSHVCLQINGKHVYDMSREQIENQRYFEKALNTYVAGPSMWSGLRRRLHASHAQVRQSGNRVNNTELPLNYFGEIYELQQTCHMGKFALCPCLPSFHIV